MFSYCCVPQLKVGRGCLAAGRWLSRVPSPRALLHVKWRSLSALVPPCALASVWSAASGSLSGLRVLSRHMGCPHHQHGAPSVCVARSLRRVRSWWWPRPLRRLAMEESFRFVDAVGCVGGVVVLVEDDGAPVLGVFGGCHGFSPVLI